MPYVIHGQSVEESGLPRTDISISVLLLLLVIITITIIIIIMATTQPT